MNEWFSSNSEAWRWFFLLLSVGVLDGLIQLSDYLHWRKERREADDAND